MLGMYISTNKIPNSMASNGSTGTAQDLSSILSQVKGLEEEKAKLMKLLDDERERVKEAQAKAEKMSEGKRQEMRQALDTVIMNWLKDSVQDEKVRDEFTKGMNRLVENTAEDSGVWQVVCCASNVHARHLQQIEQMRVENESLKSRSGGEFRDENARKRGREDDGPSEPANIWSEFEHEMRGGRVFGGPVL